MIELHLHDSNNLIDLDFAEWLLERIQIKLISNLKKYNLKRWDEFFSSSLEVSRLYAKNYRAEDILLFAIKHMKCTVTTSELRVTFNGDILVPGFDRLKLSTAIKLINYGTRSVKGCPLFSNTFEEIRDDIQNYIRMYYMI